MLRQQHAYLVLGELMPCSPAGRRASCCLPLSRSSTPESAKSGPGLALRPRSGRTPFDDANWGEGRGLWSFHKAEMTTNHG